MQPWKRILLTEDQLQVIYREWGVFYTHKQKLDIAANYYDVSLDLKADPKAFFNRSRCKRNIAQTEGALCDARAAMANDPLSQPYNLEVSDGLYQLNEFEKSKCESFNNSLKFRGLKLRAFNDRSDVLEENFEATLGENLGSFILENEKYVRLAFEKLQREKNVDKRPLWKILLEQDKCDVLSVLEVEEELISPREIARRKRAFNVFNQIYMRRSWIDVLFLRALRNNPNLLLPQSQWSRPQLEHVTKTKYNVTIKFLKMLHARCPMYTEKIRKCPNKKLSKKLSEDYLFRVQYQIHRNMLAILKRIRFLRSAKQLEKLSKYVEEVMGDYVVLKTHRVMPWKFEFINEVYNLLALAHIDRYVVIPRNLLDFKYTERLNALLKMTLEKDTETQPFVFGNRATHQDESSGDLAHRRHKEYLARLDKRIIFAKNPIERAYLWHEMARDYLKHSHYNECCLVARKSIDEAKKCNSLVWMLLGLLVICKSHACLGTIERVVETLEDVSLVAAQLSNEKIQNYVILLRDAVEQMSLMKKQEEALRNVKSTMAQQGNSFTTM